MEAAEALTRLAIRIGEKMIDWSDETPSMETILANVSLYWFTGCYPSSIYPYREVGDTLSDAEMFLVLTTSFEPH